MIESRKYRVELLFNTTGQVPEHRVVKIVSSNSDEAAVQAAKALVSVEDPNLNHLQIDTWFVAVLSGETLQE